MQRWFSFSFFLFFFFVVVVVVGNINPLVIFGYSPCRLVKSPSVEDLTRVVAELKIYRSKITQLSAHTCISANEIKEIILLA